MSKGTCTTIQLLATGVIAFLSEKLGITFYLLGLLVFLMVVDYISGMIASMVEAIDHPALPVLPGYSCPGSPALKGPAVRPYFHPSVHPESFFRR